MVGLLFSSANIETAEALFGSECRKSKSVYQMLMDNAQRSRNSELARVKDYVVPKINIQAEVKKCLANGTASKLACQLAAEDKQRASSFLKIPNFSAEQQQKKRAARVVVNNKKCFDPLVVVSSQELLEQK